MSREAIDCRVLLKRHQDPILLSYGNAYLILNSSSFRTMQLLASSTVQHLFVAFNSTRGRRYPREAYPRRI